jgi:hypothetical protein
MLLLMVLRLLFLVAETHVIADGDGCCLTIKNRGCGSVLCRSPIYSLVRIIKHDRVRVEVHHVVAHAD